MADVKAGDPPSEPPGPFGRVVAEAVEKIRAGDGPDQALLFTGNRHYAVPAGLINDALLSPVDKIIWLVICQYAGGNTERTAFPSYEQIQRDAHVGSSATIARSLHALRLTRWLTRVARVRDPQVGFEATSTRSMTSRCRFQKS